jgi:hypothetical protein
MDGWKCSSCLLFSSFSHRVDCLKLWNIQSQGQCYESVLSLSLSLQLSATPSNISRPGFCSCVQVSTFHLFSPASGKEAWDAVLCCMYSCILYAFPYRFSLLLFHLSLSLSLLLFSDDESFKNRKGWDGRGQWGEIPEAEVFPAVSIRLMHLFPGSAAWQRKKMKGWGDRFECCRPTMYGFCFGKDIKKKNTKSWGYQ